MTALAPVAGTVAALTLLGGASAATEVAGPQPVPQSESRALALLDQATERARLTSYRGVQFVSGWGTRGTSRVLVDVRNLPGEGLIMRVRRSAGRPGGALFVPIGGGSLPSGLTATGGGPVGLLARNYSVVMAGTGSVAGRGTDVVESRRRDGSVAGRFWLDSRTGLILRREVLDRRGATVRASAFIDISFGPSQFTGHLPPMVPDAWRSRVTTAEVARLREAGWRCPDGLPPRLYRYDVRRSDDADGQVLHASYSDGLSSVSVFQQKGPHKGSAGQVRVDLAGLPGHRAERLGGGTVYVRDGVRQSVVWSAGGTVYTVLADAPQETVAAVVASLPHDRARTGVVARLERGLSRVTSWVNPFG